MGCTQGGVTWWSSGAVERETVKMPSSVVCNCHYYKTPLYRQGVGVFDFSSGHLVTRFYSGSLVMSQNCLSLLWPSIATVLGDITSSLIVTVTIP
jgi:hypothetical protein